MTLEKIMDSLNRSFVSFRYESAALISEVIGGRVTDRETERRRYRQERRCETARGQRYQHEVIGSQPENAEAAHEREKKNQKISVLDTDILNERFR